MRFTALLLLAALARTLVCAQDAISDPMEAAPSQDPMSSEQEENTTPAKSALPQETATAAQKTLVAARIASQRQGLNYLKAVIEKTLLLAQKAFEEAERKVNERIHDGKQIIENGADFLKGIKRRFDPRNN